MSDAERFLLDNVDNESSLQIYTAIEAEHYKHCEAI